MNNSVTEKDKPVRVQPHPNADKDILREQSGDKLNRYINENWYIQGRFPPAKGPVLHYDKDPAKDGNAYTDLRKGNRKRSKQGKAIYPELAEWKGSYLFC